MPVLPSTLLRLHLRVLYTSGSQAGVRGPLGYHEGFFEDSEKLLKLASCRATFIDF